MPSTSKKEICTRRPMSSSRVLATAAIMQTCVLGPVHGAELTAGVPSVAEPQEYHFGDKRSFKPAFAQYSMSCQF